MRSLVLLLLSCLSCTAQLNVQQPMFQLTSVSTTPQLPTGDLFVWLKPESLVGSEGVGVTNWMDSSGWRHDVTNFDLSIQKPYITNNIIKTYSGVRFLDDAQSTLLFGTNNGRNFLVSQSGLTLHFLLRTLDKLNSTFFSAEGTNTVRLSLNRQLSAQNGQLYVQGSAPDNQATQSYLDTLVLTNASDFQLWSYVFYFTNATFKFYRNGTLEFTKTSFIGPSVTDPTPKAVGLGRVLSQGMNFELVEFIGYTNAQNSAALNGVFDYIEYKFFSYGNTTNSLLSTYDISALNYSDGTAISNVPDSGPLSYTLTNAVLANRPYWTNNAGIINNEGFAWFDGSNDGLTNNYTVTYPQPTHIFWVGSEVGGAGVSRALFNNASDVAHYQGAWEFNNAGAISWYAGTQSDTPVTNPDAWTIWEFLFDGPNSFVRTNNVLVQAASVGINGKTGMHLGVGYDMTASMLGGIAWCSVYTNRLSSISASNLVQSLGTRYGITTYTRN